MGINLPAWLLALVVPQRIAERIWRRTLVTGTSRRRYVLFGGMLTVDFTAEMIKPPAGKPDEGGD